MTERRDPARGLRLIAAFKLLKGLALLALGIGALRLLHKDVDAVVEHWINIFQVDPHSHYIQLLLAKLSKVDRSEEHTSELQSRLHLVCRLLLEKKKKIRILNYTGY